MSTRIALFCTSLCVLTNCVPVQVKKLVNHQVDKNAPKGLRFYRPHPYLVVTRSVKKTDKVTETVCTSRIEYLPELEDAYVIELKPWLGTVDAKFKFEDGWKLTEYGQISDARIPETINAISGLIGAIGPLFPAPSPEAEFIGEDVPCREGLYRIDYDSTKAQKKLTLTEAEVLKP